MEERLKHLICWAKGSAAPPVKFDLFLTNRCNLLCQFCHYPFLPKFRYEDELSHEKIMSLVRQAGELGAKVFGILGGEPFLRKKTTLEAMTLAKGLGMSGAAITNGTLLNEKDMRRIITMRWDLLRFSIDAPNATIHDTLRGVKGSFDKTVGTMASLQRLKRKSGSSHPTVEINMVLTRSNMFQLSGMMRLAHEHAVHRIYVLPVIEFGKDISSLKLRGMDAASVLPNIEGAEELGKELGVESNLDTIKNNFLFTKSNEIDSVLLGEQKCNHHIPCFFPWYGMSIDAQGWLTPCGQIETEMKINVRDYASLWDAWTSEYFTVLRQEMAQRRLPKGCERCCMPFLDENGMLREELARRNITFSPTMLAEASVNVKS